MAENTTPGGTLRSLRKQAGLTLRDVAARLTDDGEAVTHQAVSTWETNQHPVPRRAIPLLEKVLGCSDGDIASLYGYNAGASVQARLDAVEAELTQQRRVLEELLRRLPEPPPGAAPRPQGRR